jgi:hypothetical protein
VLILGRRRVDGEGKKRVKRYNVKGERLSD